LKSSVRIVVTVEFSWRERAICRKKTFVISALVYHNSFNMYRSEIRF